MKVFRQGAFVAPDILETIVLGSVVDPNVVRLEQLVADYYDTSVYELNNWVRDTDAKKMICFLLHWHLHYSIGSVAKQYRIDKGLLRNVIKLNYQNCLLDKVHYDLVHGFVSGLDSINTKAV